MHRYEVLGQLGDGAFGEVVKACNRETNEIVAVKILKRQFKTWEECLQLRELKALKKLKHPNIVKLAELVKEQKSSQLYFVFEFCDSNLHIKMQNTRKFAHFEINDVMTQLFTGLAFIHRNGFFHRDIKPENLLFKGRVLKIADLGCCREIRSRPPYTEYIATRWYRAPEILLQSQTYNSPVDVWACGCILAELYRGYTLFPGTTSADTLLKVVDMLGTPTTDQWPDVAQVANGFKFPKCERTPWSKIMPEAPQSALQLTAACLLYDPYRRPTATQALQSQFLTEQQNVPPARQAAPAKSEAKGGELGYRDQKSAKILEQSVSVDTLEVEGLLGAPDKEMDRKANAEDKVSSSPFSFYRDDSSTGAKDGADQSFSEDDLQNLLNDTALVLSS